MLLLPSTGAGQGGTQQRPAIVDLASPFVELGVHLRAPAGFVTALKQRDSTTWSSPVFDGRGDVTVRVFQDDRSFDQALNHAREVTGEVTYERIKLADDWFVVTGWRGDLGRYEKTHVWRDGAVLRKASLIITFQRDAQPAYAEPIRVLSHSFVRRPERAGPGAPVSRRSPPPSPGPEEGPRRAPPADSSSSSNSGSAPGGDGNVSPYREDCLPYGPPASVELRGRIIRDTVPGEPNFQSVARGDAPRDLLLLLLDRPTCTLDGAFDDEVAEDNQREVQLVMEKHEHFSSGQPVRLRGYLFHAVAAGHYRPLLLLVTDTLPSVSIDTPGADWGRILLIAGILALSVALPFSIRWWRQGR